jgi:hypothetical protein
MTLKQRIKYIIFAGGVLFVAYLFVVSGAPYIYLDCSENRVSYLRESDQMPLKDPSGLCEEKKDSIHPTVFDLRIHLEQQMGIKDYTSDSISDEQPLKYRTILS